MRTLNYGGLLFWVIIFIPFFAVADSFYTDEKGEGNQPLSYSIPFELIDNLIVVMATVDGQMGKFIFDSGAPELMLNAQYFDSKPTHRSKQSSGITGTIQNLGQLKVKKFDWYGFTKNRFIAKVVDLQHLEKRKNIKIHGLIGFEIFRNFELVIDYQKRYIELWRLNSKGHRIDTNSNLAIDSMTFQMKGHLAWLNTKVANQKMRLALDSGAEINLIDRRFEKAMKTAVGQRKEYQLTGVDPNGSRAQVGKLKTLLIDHRQFPKLDVMLYEMNSLNDRSGIRLDGILGYGFLSRARYAINYKKKKIYVLTMENLDASIPKPLTDCPLF